METCYDALPIVPSLCQASLEEERRDGCTTLQDFHAAECLLHIDSNYVIVAKPAEVRMDGDFDVTLQKLLLSWVPGSSLSTLKWVHQLDYATSGILCVARNKAAAGLASAAFESRETSKQYLAVLEGHVDPGKWPLRPAPAVAAAGEGEVSSSRKGGAKKAISTQPASQRGKESTEDIAGTSCTWQDDVMKETLRINLASLQTYLESRRAEGREVEEPLLPFSSAAGGVDGLYEELLRSWKRRKTLRKALLKCGVASAETPVSVAPPAPLLPCTPTPFAAADPLPATAVAESFHQKSAAGVQGVYREEVPEPEESLAAVAGAAAAAGGGDTHTQILTQIYIDMNVAEVSGDFRCEAGHEGNPGKASETRVRVLQKGHHFGRPVTKVLLLPYSGRRHQLRVHCRAMGHPIVGDCTYGLPCAKEEERMMLHAYKLLIPVPQAARGNLHRAKYKEMQLEPGLELLLQGEAPDPFGDVVE